MNFSSTFSSSSIERLKECDIKLQILLNSVAKTGLVNFGITTGFRSKEEQNKKYQEGKSKVQWPDSKHNTNPSIAADVAIWLPSSNQYTWDKSNYAYLAGIVFTHAYLFGIDIRWGGNWDQDLEIVTDQSFDDLAHFELVD